MTKRGQASTEWIIGWIFQGMMTIVVVVGVLLTVRAYIDVTLAPEESQRALLVQKLLHEPALVYQHPLTLSLHPGQFDQAKIKKNAQTEKNLEDSLHHPQTWNKRAVYMKIGDVGSYYRKAVWFDLYPLQSYKGKSASYQYDFILLVGAKEKTLSINKETWHILEQNS